ncbi:MAG: hypothetical protein IBX50_04105 [Marinospirillum sp.]|uniref:hypothetical protein n=1 Tax=Marinospirillum sp. TaxID=2183934 RepID=UPI0019DD5802|nr:hypothetical protein [Marinospirillum sp.]MBE0505889.1 hypothetical protein [Marinospirillum sp.]
MARKSKADWIDFFTRFEASGLSLANYCEKVKVAYQSAKNWASQLRKTDEYPVSGAGIGTGTGTKAPKRRRRTSTKAAKKARKPHDSDNDFKIADFAEKLGKKAPQDAPKKEWKKQWDNLIPIKPGEQRAMKHGAYAGALPPEIDHYLATYGRNDLRNLEEEIRLTKGRLMLVSKKRAEWDAMVEYDEDLTPRFDVTEIKTETGTGAGGEFSKKTKTLSRPDFESQEERLTRRLAWLTQVQEQLSKRPAMSADDAVSLRASVIRAGMEDGKAWSEIGLEIEMHGLELPFSIKALIQRELEQPIEEPDGGLTDDELEKLSQQYYKEIAHDAEWVEVRKSEIKEIHAVQAEEKTAQ